MFIDYIEEHDLDLSLFIGESIKTKINKYNINTKLHITLITNLIVNFIYTMEDELKYLTNYLNRIDDYLTIICESPLDKQQTLDNSALNNPNKDNFHQALSPSEVVIPYETYDKKKFKFSTYRSSKKYDEKRLKQYKFRFLKRKSIDKKLITSLKYYLRKHLNRFKSTIIDEFLMNKYATRCVINNELRFNSINYKYLKWLFSHKEIRDAYQEFINDELDLFVYKIASNYGVSYKDDLSCLRSYINDYACLYK